VPDDFLHPQESTGLHIQIYFSSRSSLLFSKDNFAGNAFGGMPDSMDIDTLAQPPDKATYAEQANKRTHCRRLTK